MRPTLLAAALLALAAVPAPGATSCNPTLLRPKVPRAGGQFGCSVALRDGIFSVGANLDGAGSVSLFHAGSSTPDATLVPAGGKPGDEFGRSVVEDGGWLAVGAPFADGPRASGSGVVYLFQRQADGSWSEPQVLSAGDAARADHFGLTAAMSGGTLLVGAPNQAHAGSLSGAVYVFQLVGGVWVQRQKLTAGDAAAFDNFSFSLALDGDTAVVGSPFHDRGSAGNAGAAYVFQRIGGIWSQQAELTAGDGAADDQFGSAVALSGDALAVGARRDDAGGLHDAGSVYVFEGHGSAWRERAHFFGEAADDLFGVSAAMSGNRLLVGALFHAGKGAVYLFERQRTPDGTGPWHPGDAVDGNPKPGDAFGQSVALDGDSLLVGSYLADPGSLSNAGSATVCETSEPPPIRLKITDTDGFRQVFQGQLLTYTITVTNLGTGTVTGILVTDELSPKLENISWADQMIPSLAPDQSAVFTATGNVKTNATGVLTNTACARVPGNDPVCSDDPPDTIVQIPVADLGISMTATAKAASRLIYQLSVVNLGPDRATDVLLTDSPGPGLLPVRDLLPAGCSIQEEVKVVCQLHDLKLGERTELVLTFDVTDPCATQATNHAEVSASEEDPDFRNNVSDLPSSLARTASLRVEKTGPATAKSGDSISYTVKVTNQGPDCVPEAVLADPVPAGLVVPVLPPGCTLNGATLECRLHNLLPQAEDARAVNLSFMVAACGGQITNTATVKSVGVDPPVSSAAMTATAVVPSPLAISKTDGLTTAVPGQELLYTIVVSSPNGCAVDPVTISDTPPGGLTQVLWCRDAPQPCTPLTPLVMGKMVDTIPLPAGGSATYRLRGIVDGSFLGPLINTATATWPAGTVSASDRTDVDFTGVKAFCDGLAGMPTEGGMVTYTFLLVNNGPANQADNSGNEFTDVLPAGLTLVSASATSGTAATAGNTATWNGSIPVGGTVTITVVATINFGTLGQTICNPAAFAFDADGNGSNESSSTVSPACCFTVGANIPIPTLSGAGLAALSLLLAGLAVLRLRRRSL